MEDNYFVLHQRQISVEKAKNYGEKMRYSSCRTFAHLADAKAFAFKQMPAVLGKRGGLTEESTPLLRDPTQPYVVAAKRGEYLFCMGEGETVHHYDAQRCGEDTVEAVMEELSGEEHTYEMLLGIELKLF